MHPLQLAQEEVTTAECSLRTAKEQFENIKIKYSLEVGKNILEKSPILKNDTIKNCVLGNMNVQELQSFYMAKHINDTSVSYFVLVDVFDIQYRILDNRNLSDLEVERLNNTYEVLATDFIEYGLDYFGIDMEESGLSEYDILDVFDEEIKEFLSTVVFEYTPRIA